jgi:hypothetical protein
MPRLHRRCAWCLKDLGGPVAAPDTHGVCPDCKRTLIPTFLDTLPGPTFLVGDGARVTSANAAARAEVGKPLEALEDRHLGDVLGCDRGSGHPACPVCDVVVDTLLNGTPHAGLRTSLRTPAGVVALVVSTRRVKQGVLLTFDHPPSV